MATPVDVPIKDEHEIPKWKKSTVGFVLGGPGSGKGTQCANVVKHFRYTHFSAGVLLRAEIRSGSEFGAMIQSMIAEGKIVPSEITVNLLCKAMEESGTREEKTTIDYNLETIKKRFKVFVESTLPVVSYYESKGKLRKIDAAKPSEEVFEAVKVLFASET